MRRRDRGTGRLDHRAVRGSKLRGQSLARHSSYSAETTYFLSKRFCFVSPYAAARRDQGQPKRRCRRSIYSRLQLRWTIACSGRAMFASRTIPDAKFPVDVPVAIDHRLCPACFESCAPLVIASPRDQTGILLTGLTKFSRVDRDGYDT